jgi:hypothetical protein
MRTRFHFWIFALAVIACEPPPTRVASDTSHAGRSPSARSSTDAEEVVRAYYAAINARDYQRAYEAWADDGPPGRPTVQAFAAGFAVTDSVQAVLGAPGRIEGAAGSRYVTIPVRIRAFHHGGGVREYAGSYTVRQSVVPGSDAAARRWHLYSASLH